MTTCSWLDVGLAAGFLDGEHRLLQTEEREIAVFRVDGEFYAIEDSCSHEHVRLSEGDLDGAQIVCPRHGARFDVRSGQALTPPAYDPVRKFDVRVLDGVVQIYDGEVAPA